MIGPEPPYRPRVLVLAPHTWLCVQSLDHFKRLQRTRAAAASAARAAYREANPEKQQVT